MRYAATTTENPVVQEMKLELARLEVQRSGLLEKFTPEYQEAKALDAKVQQVRARLKQEVEKIVSSESMRINDVYQKVLIDELSAEADIQALSAKHQSLSNAIGHSRTRLTGLTGSSAKLAELTLRLEVSERSYKLLNEAYEEARIAEYKSSSEVNVLQNALVPSEPVRPIKILHVGAAALMSLILAIGIVFFLDFLDPTLRDSDDVRRVLKVPVLTAVPKAPAEDLDWCRGLDAKG